MADVIRLKHVVVADSERVDRFASLRSWFRSFFSARSADLDEYREITTKTYVTKEKYLSHIEKERCFAQMRMIGL